MNEKMPEEGATKEKPVCQEDSTEAIVDKPSPPKICHWRSKNAQ